MRYKHVLNIYMTILQKIVKVLRKIIIQCYR
nr:MAG TPA: hypothetical protein [Caudoviricetes sp.]